MKKIRRGYFGKVIRGAYVDMGGFDTFYVASRNFFFFYLYFRLIWLFSKFYVINIYVYIVGVRFRSCTNGCATRSSEELKPRNLFDGTV